jgi:hypothetical protein
MIIGWGSNTVLSKYVGPRKKMEINEAKAYWDGQILKPTPYLDDKLVIRDGVLLA